MAFASRCVCQFHHLSTEPRGQDSNLQCSFERPVYRCSPNGIRRNVFVTS